MRWEVPFVHKKSHLFSSLISASQVIKEVQDFYRDTYNKLKGKDDPQRETLKAIHYAVRWPHKDATLLSSPCFRTCVYPFQSSWGVGFSGFLCFWFFFFFLGPHQQHMEIPRLGVKLQLELPQQHQIRATSAACTTAHGSTGSLSH